MTWSCDRPAMFGSQGSTASSCTTMAWVSAPTPQCRRRLLWGEYGAHAETAVRQPELDPFWRTGMMFRTRLVQLSALPVLLLAQPAHATYSIVAADQATRQVGGSVTSCVAPSSVASVYGGAPG